MILIKALSVKFGDFRMTLEEVAIPSYVLVAAVALMITAIFLWAFI